MKMEFAVKWPKKVGELGDQPTYVITKLYQSLEGRRETYLGQYSVEHEETFGNRWDGFGEKHRAKIHHLQEGNCWEAGMTIAPVVRYQLKGEFFQFAPSLMCFSVQPFKILYYQGIYQPFVILGERELNRYELTEFVLNEGFDSIVSFTKYYDTDFIGQLVHWTPKYY